MHSIIALIFMYLVIQFMKRTANNTVPETFRYIKYFIIKRPSAKWRTRHSIYAQIRHNPSKPDLVLIDEPINPEFKLSYGMADAVGIYDSPDTADDKFAELSHLFAELARTGNRTAGTRIYEIIKSFSIYSFIYSSDRITDDIANNHLNIFPYLYYYARDLVKHSANRNAVKLGLAIMAMCHQKQAIKIAMRVGHHEEFGLWATNTVKALCQTTNTRINNKIFKLARNLRGWGQIAILWNNASSFTKKCQKDWLFFNASKSFYSYSEFPDVCIKYGEFAKRMAKNKISQKTFNTSTNIIYTILDHGKILSFDEMRPMRDWIRHSKYHIQNTRDLYMLRILTAYMVRRSRNFAKTRMKIDTTKIINIANRTLAEMPVRDIILSDIKKQQNCYCTSKLIATFDTDLFDEVWDILVSNPYNSDIWYIIINCMRVRTPRKYKIERLIMFANDIITPEPDTNTEILRHIMQNIAIFRFLSERSEMWNLIKMSLGTRQYEAGLNAIIKMNVSTIPDDIKKQLVAISQSNLHKSIKLKADKILASQAH